MKRYYTAWILGLLLSASSASAAVLATVNGDEITSDEVNKVLMEGTQGRFDSLPADKQNELRQRIIEGMIAQELVYDDAQKIGVLDSKEYKQELEALVNRLKVQLAAKVWEQQQFEAIKVDAKEVKAYFDANPEEFVDKEKIHARHILVKTEGEAQSIIKSMKGLSGDKLRNEFIAQAKSKSTGPSAAKGGDLGYFPRGQMVPSFNDAAFAMKEGAISSTPVQSQFGYHVIYIEDKKPAKKLGFDEVKNFIEQRLKMDKFKATMEKKMSDLRAKAKIIYTK
ncbi:PpiC-type peptidyl-prolyl cis-trans isomerase [Sulfuricurvum kujiense DSM 16994]|uniref:peptidylprolyl isomerase n=1 Tax=Sulfuricurvum kujiense (strain ATCC BAA-921 / DSM 16994 / JCM 11577 / YK-1) TaxID=709032 RepID=E4U0R5_SULKY|nr:peptidylprolyl isomerase [Sulfuricurvum kujiense]ADR33291.1 PpiC-type peptidyl-prolyl cis-trans isomerase [Sulfuricurvum kujiense DSM 16994]